MKLGKFTEEELYRVLKQIKKRKATGFNKIQRNRYSHNDALQKHKSNGSLI